jgi:Electron transfer DM13
VWIGAGAVVAIGLAVFVWVWFEPQAMFTDDRVDQAVPTAGPTTTAAEPDQPASEPSVTTTAPPAPPEPAELGTGSFVSLDHTTSGTVRVLELADGRRFVRLEGFETDNGPDLYVYLSTNPADGPEGAFDDDHADLGRLQGNIGDQNYEIPGDLDPARYASVVIWCDRFDAAFGAADLTPQPR